MVFCFLSKAIINGFPTTFCGILMKPILLILYPFVFFTSFHSLVGNKMLLFLTLSLFLDSLEKPASSFSYLCTMALKDLLGYHPCLSLKYLSSKIGGVLCHRGPPNKYKRLDAKLEKKMIELKKSSSGSKNFLTINSIIMKFSQFKEGLKTIRGVFEEYDEDFNGIIDREELNKCLQKLLVNLEEEEIEDLFHSCDIDGSHGIQFNEFIVLLCLIYFLVEHSSSPRSVSGITSTSSSFTSRTGSPELEATFNTIVEAFLFLDKQGKGKLKRKDVINALNDASPWEKSPAHITENRFKEMDWDRHGEVSFRNFLFALISWVGIDAEEDIHVHQK